MQDLKTKTFSASASVSDIQSSDIYLTVKARLFDLKPNANNVRVTEAFMDEIVDNEEKYIGIPLCADVKGLTTYRKIDHQYNKLTRTYGSTFIGSFYHFEKELEGDETYLIGYARIMKRHKDICAAVQMLYELGELKFSFEISASVYEMMDDGEIVVDADEGNFLEGVAIVTFPACKGAVALDLIAQEEREGDEDMENVNTEIQSTEQITAADPKQVAASEDVAASADQAENVNAAYVSQTHTEIDEAHVYNDDVDTHVETCTRVTVNQHVDDNQNASNDEADSDDNANDTPGDDDEADDAEHQNASSESTASNDERFEKLQAAIDELTKQFASLQNKLKDDAQKLSASVNTQQEMLPDLLMADISTSKQYALLEPEKSEQKEYTLI